MTYNPIVKKLHQDFLVNEVSVLPGHMSEKPLDYQHTIFELKKDGYTTFEAINIVSHYLGVKRQDIHCEGLKDEDAITTQVISVHKIISQNELKDFYTIHKSLKKGWISLRVIGYSPEPVVEKRLHANIFHITLRNLSEKNAHDIQDFCEKHSDFISLNYYDQQRFGLPGGPYIAHYIGRAIVDQNWDEAANYYIQSGNATLDYPDGLPIGFNFKSIDSRKLQFFISAFASANWNEALSNQIENNESFIIFDDHAVKSIGSPSNKLPLTLADKTYILNNDCTVQQKIKHRATTVTTTLYCGDLEDDELYSRRYKLTLEFMLPTGSYATMVMKQLVAACGLQRLCIGD